MNFLKKRSARYGGISGVFTAVVLVLVLLFNAAFSLLAMHFSLFTDLTDAGIWSLSDAAKAVIAEAGDDITITFCHEKDYVESNTYLHYVSQTAQEMAKAFPNIHVRYINSILEPQMFRDYRYTTESTISTTSVIIERGDATTRPVGESPAEFRICALPSFFVSDTASSAYWAYNGEEVLAAACLAVTADETPTVYFTDGHGENFAEHLEFVNTLSKAGFAVGTVDLLTEEIPDDCRALIIFGPKRDFVGADITTGAPSELAKIEKFLGSNGTLMVFKDPAVGNLQNLGEFLAEWGVIFADGVVTDSEHSLSADGQTVLATYSDCETLGASLAKDIRTEAVPAKTVMANAGAIRINTDLYTAARDAEGQNTHTWVDNRNNYSREISTVLLSSPSATLRTDGEVTDRAGSYNLMTVTSAVQTRNNDVYYAYVFAANSTDWVSDNYLQTNAFANKDLLYYAARVMGREKVPADIDFKVFHETEIENMTTAQATRVGVALIAVLPILTFGTGLVVLTRRKYR